MMPFIIHSETFPVNKVRNTNLILAERIHIIDEVSERESFRKESINKRDVLTTNVDL